MAFHKAGPLALLAYAGLLISCLSPSSDLSSAPVVQFASVGFDKTRDTLAVGQSIAFSGSVAGTQELKSWRLVVLDGSGIVVDSAILPNILGLGSNVTFNQPSTNLRITNPGTWGPTGLYTVRLRVTQTTGESVTTDLKIWAKGTETGGNNGLLDHGGVKLGAQGASPGSFLDVLNAKVWTSSNAHRPDSTIDIVFGVDLYGVPSVMSPAQANSDGFLLTGWTRLNSTIIAYSSTQLYTAVDVKAVIDGSNNGSMQKVPAQPGWYAVKLNTGTYAALHLTNLSTGDSTATADLEVFE